MPAILCPVDFSDESLIALRRAATIAAHSGARLAALHVADALLVHAAESAFHRDVVGHERARALQEAVDSIRREATAASGVDICVYVAVGDPAAEICTFCTLHTIDLIVMASHQVKGYRLNRVRDRSSRRQGRIRRVMHGKRRVESPIVRRRPGPGDPEALRGVA